MAFVHGKNAYVAMEASVGAGTVTDYSAYFNDISLSRSIETAETTTFGDSDKEYIVGLRDATVSLSGLFDGSSGAIDEVLEGLLGAGKIVVHLATNGSTASTTNPVYKLDGGTGNFSAPGAIITSYDISPAVGDVIPFSVDIQVSGAITRATS
jgi:hypothetical protein